MIDLSIYTRSTQEEALVVTLEKQNPLTTQERIEHLKLDEELLGDFFLSLAKEYGVEASKYVVQGFLLGVAFVAEIEEANTPDE
jgi:hypothetical protein